VVDEIAGQQRRAGDAEVAPHAVHRDAHAGVLPLGGDDGEPDRMIDRREHADDEQADADLQGRLRKSGGDRGEADADEEHAHHALAAPFVGEPPGRQGEQAEGEEAGSGIGEQIAVADAPLAAERQRRHGGEDQGEQVIEEMADVEQQELRTVTVHAGWSLRDDGRIVKAAPTLVRQCSRTASALSWRRWSRLRACQPRGR
jgi:hypothetical protein